VDLKPLTHRVGQAFACLEAREATTWHAMQAPLANRVRQYPDGVALLTRDSPSFDTKGLPSRLLPRPRFALVWETKKFEPARIKTSVLIIQYQHFDLPKINRMAF